MAFISRPLHSKALRPCSVFGRPIISNNGVSFSSGTTTSPSGNTAGGTMRAMYTVGGSAISDVVVLFQNWASGSQTGEAGVTNATTVSSVVLEIPGVSNQFLFFEKGGISTTLNPLESITTVPYKVTLAAGATFFIRWYWTVPASTTVASPPAVLVPNSSWNNFATPAGPNITTNSGTTGLTANESNLYGSPTAILGTPLVSGASSETMGATINASVGLFGDSLFDCGSNSALSWTTWPVPNLLGVGMSIVRASIRGDLTSGNVGDGFTRCRNLLLAECDVVLIAFGTNDLFIGTTAAAIAGYFKTMFTKYAEMGCQVFISTVVPRTTSTDGWTTAVNQTVVTGEAQRQALNAYLRAPIGAGAGNSVLADNVGTLTGVLDAAATVETDAFNSAPSLRKPNVGGMWNVLPGAVAGTNDGIHPLANLFPQMGNCMNTSAMGRRLLAQRDYT